MLALIAHTCPAGFGTTSSSFLQQQLWKREGKPDRDRFELPYNYSTEKGDALCIKQAPFDAEGFASTVWDSAIVLSKFFEAGGRHAWPVPRPHPSTARPATAVVSRSLAL